MARSIQIPNIFFRKVDAIKAYTQTLLKARVLVKLPDGFKQYDSEGNEMCVVLAKALEGLRESGNLWQADTVQWLTNEGENGCFGQGAFTQLSSEPTTFKIAKGNAYLAISVWVDDFWCACNDEKFFDRGCCAAFSRCVAAWGVEVRCAHGRYK